MFLDNPLHVVYIVTPLHHSLKPDFSHLWNLFESGRKRNSLAYRLLSSLGVDEALVFKWKNSPPSRDAVVLCTDKLRVSKLSASVSCSQGLETATLSRVKRLWAALAICDIFQGYPFEAIADKFRVQVGDIENLLDTVGMLAKKVQLFLKELGWSSMEVICCI
jgi:hypothetical protein